MSTLRVHDILHDRVLVSRESARVIEDAVAELIRQGRADGDAARNEPFTIDFDGVGGVAPSFVDELVLIFVSQCDIMCGGTGPRRLVIANPPTRLSSKFEAIARGHHMSIEAQSDGSWLLADARKTDT